MPTIPDREKGASRASTTSSARAARSCLSAGKTLTARNRRCERWHPASPPPRMESPQFRLMPPALRARPWMRQARGGEISRETARRASVPVHLLCWTPSELRSATADARLCHESGAVLTGTVAHIAWSFAAVGPDGEVYPEGREPIHPDGHPLPHAIFLPGSLRPDDASAPFTSSLANNDALWPGLPQS